MGSNPTLSATDFNAGADIRPRPGSDGAFRYSHRSQAANDSRCTVQIQGPSPCDQRHADVLTGRRRHTVGEVPHHWRYGGLRRPLLQAGGLQSYRVFQRPGNGGGRGKGRRGRRPEHSLRLYRQHQHIGRRLRSVYGDSDDGHSAEEQRVQGQAGAGHSLRRAYHGHQGQLRQRARPRPRAGRKEPDHPGQLGESQPHPGSEDSGVRDRGGPRRGPGPGVHPGGQRWEHHSLLGWASRRRLPTSGRRRVRE